MGRIGTIAQPRAPKQSSPGRRDTRQQQKNKRKRKEKKNRGGGGTKPPRGQMSPPRSKQESAGGRLAAQTGGRQTKARGSVIRVEKGVITIVFPFEVEAGNTQVSRPLINFQHGWGDTSGTEECQTILFGHDVRHLHRGVRGDPVKLSFGSESTKEFVNLRIDPGIQSLRGDPEALQCKPVRIRRGVLGDHPSIAIEEGDRATRVWHQCDPGRACHSESGCIIRLSPPSRGRFVLHQGIALPVMMQGVLVIIAK